LASYLNEVIFHIWQFFIIIILSLSTTVRNLVLSSSIAFIFHRRQKVWEEASAKTTVAEGDDTEVERGKTKRGGKEPESRKRAKIDTGEGVV
jgi:hypothetical protein